MLALLSDRDGVIMVGVDCINKPLAPATFTLLKKQTQADFYLTAVAVGRASWQIVPKM